MNYNRRAYFLPLCIILGLAAGIASRHIAMGIGIGTALGLLFSRTGAKRGPGSF